VEDVPIPTEVAKLLEEYVDVIPDELPNGLPLKRAIQHHIDLIPISYLPNQATYRMSLIQHEELNQQVKELIKKVLVRESMSPCVVPALLVPKKDNTWRMYTKSKAINKITTEYRFLIPCLDDIMDVLARAKYFSKIDLRSGYHQIWICEGGEWKNCLQGHG
jgi:uncharacterized protein (DUF2344 family)